MQVNAGPGVIHRKIWHVGDNLDYVPADLPRYLLYPQNTGSVKAQEKRINIGALIGVSRPVKYVLQPVLVALQN